MTPFHVGMKVVCVDDHPRFVAGSRVKALNGQTYKILPWSVGPVVGQIYTVRKVGQSPYDGEVCLWLNEIIRPVRNIEIGEMGYTAARFRPVHETRMEELRSLLLPTPDKQKERV